MSLAFTYGKYTFSEAAFGLVLGREKEGGSKELHMFGCISYKRKEENRYENEGKEINSSV